MPIPGPPKGWRWVIRQPSTYGILIGLFAAAIGASSALNYWEQKRTAPAILVGAGTVGVLLFTLAQHFVGLAAARKKDSTHELEGCLHTLHAMLHGPTDDCKLRLAVHRPIGEELEQVTEYI